MNGKKLPVLLILHPSSFILPVVGAEPAPGIGLASAAAAAAEAAEGRGVRLSRSRRGSRRVVADVFPDRRFCRAGHALGVRILRQVALQVLPGQLALMAKSLELATAVADHKPFAVLHFKRGH